MRILDLPGAYSLDPLTPDEQVTADVLLGRRAGESAPDFVVCVTDATNLRQNLRLVLSLSGWACPMVVALNMIDIARRKGIAIDAARLRSELGVPVVETVGVKASGGARLDRLLDSMALPACRRPAARGRRTPTAADIEHRPQPKCAEFSGASAATGSTASPSATRSMRSCCTRCSAL